MLSEKREKLISKNFAERKYFEKEIIVDKIKNRN
jgi:hypothetical protein